MDITNTLVWHQRLSDIPWTPYEDPHLPSGDHAAQVKLVHPTVFQAWFPPGFVAPAHSHPYNTFYYVEEGAIKFGDEGWFGPGSVRGVQAGHEYGPEEADPVRGVRFLLIATGPIGIDWA